MKTIKYFTIMAEKDQSEGRGGLEDTGINFSNYADAVSFTQTTQMQEFTVMGYIRGEGHSELIREKTINIFDSLLDYKTNSTYKIKEQALAKLTVEEKHVLGLL